MTERRFVSEDEMAEGDEPLAVKVHVMPAVGVELFERAVYVAQDDPLGARAVNEWRANGLLPDDIAIHTSTIIPPGCGFFAFGDGMGELLKFEPAAVAPQQEGTGE